MPIMTRRNWRRFRAVAIWLTLPILIWLWVKPNDPAFRAYFSIGWALFLLLGAPVWCSAENRTGGYCRNNSTGLLLGCHLRYHRWQKLKSAMHMRDFREVLGRLFQNPNTGAAIVGSAAAVVSAGAAVASLFVV
jgi:hypothetical protein